MMDRISICEALAKRKKINPFRKRMVTGDEKRVAYYNIVQKRSWSKCCEAAQTVAKPELTARKVLLCIWGSLSRREESRFDFRGIKGNIPNGEPTSRLEPQVQDYVEVRNPQTTIQLLEVLAKFEERYSCKATLGSRNSNNVKDEVGMSVGCLMLVIIDEIGEILKWYIDQIMVEMIIGVTIRTTVKKISGSRAGIGFKTMIADLTIGDINLETEVKMTILVEGTKEIGVRVKILVEAVKSKWDD
ncbi:uncharacterized protein TNCV_409411 [Trichonephila clavipes]|nr:uncharacterized protein TNCV_409411 [Trichonephila clavipes]